MSEITVVGIGADGWDGLAEGSRRAVREAEVVLGGARHLALLPAAVSSNVETVPWPSPLSPALPGLLAEHAERRVCVLASGDPMFFGIGTTLVDLLGAHRLRVLPHVSSVSLACARLGWPVHDTEVVSAVGRPLAALRAALAPRRRLLVLGADGRAPARVARLLAEAGYGDSELTVLEQLGGPAERVTAYDAGAAGEFDALTIVAVRCVGEARSVVPGLSDDDYAHDGQLTKREVRAVTLAKLAPTPGELLWDVGAGSGSVAVEWMRAHRTCRAVAVESRPDRAKRIVANAAALGVPDLRVVVGTAPDTLAGLDTPDAIFVGGGVTAPGLVEVCWAALRPGGRLVVNAVTVESEAVLAARYAELGGELTRIAVDRTAPVGGFTGWKAKMPVTQWTVAKR